MATIVLVGPKTFGGAVSNREYFAGILPMSTTLERLQYGYDRDSRRTWRRRALTTGKDNAYVNDGLSQVTQSVLGSLNLNCTAISGVPAGEENWDYDPTGNWRGYRVESDGSIALDQSRVHDRGNCLTQIEDDLYAVLLDRVGRLRQISPDANGDWDESQQIKWDAWGRITQIKRASDDTVLGSYAYDGLTRRTTRTVAGTTHHCYYSNQWRPLEVRKNSQTTAELQYHWGARHRDDLVRRDRATTDGGSLDGTRYVLMDYYSPAAITDADGIVTERYAFSAFGIRRILAPDFAPRSTSEGGLEFGFQGQFVDTESGFLNYGYRYYSPNIGRWLCKDPIAEKGGSNLYAFAGNDPSNAVDYLGLLKWINLPTQTDDTFVPGQTLHVYPGGPLEGTDFRTLAVTLVTWTITAQCGCCSTPGVYNCLNSFTVNFNSIIFTRSSYSSPDLSDWIRRSEFDHVDDHFAWANGPGRQVAQGVEDSRKDLSYLSPWDCEKEAIDALQKALASSFSAALAASIEKWDNSGKHTWGSPRMRP